jgi:predicted MPP superfamily phosphohydrolase
MVPTMTDILQLGLSMLAAAILIALPLYGWRQRGRAYGLFALIVLAFSVPGALLTHARVTELLPRWAAACLDAAFAYALVAAGVHLAALVSPRLRPPHFRLAISIPAMVFIGGGTLCGIWLLALLPVRTLLTVAGWRETADILRWLDAVPLAVAVAAVLTSSRPLEETVRMRLGRDGPPMVSRVPVHRYRRRTPPDAGQRPLRIAQIADPHLGPWQPVAKLKQHIEGLLDRAPDLVLLTGDFLTMEGGGTPGALAAALAPLRRLPGRCFAIFGNHDYAYPDEIRGALESANVTLLVDAEAVVTTPVGPVQILGAEYVGLGRREHIQALCARFPRRDGMMRMLLLHDPLGFQFVPRGDVDLTVSGHTHGGQLGLVSFGLDWTVLAPTRWPDHGLFAHGANRLYVHRGTGFYGFPLRIGVPGEASVLEVFLPG